jgi:uncharacterized protein (DUF983 family)
MICPECGYGPMLAKRDVYSGYTIVWHKCALCAHSEQQRITETTRS